MLVLGLLLILVAALVAGVFILAGANDPGALTLGSSFNWHPGAAAVFLTGAATLVVLVVGVAMTRVGLRRARQRRRDAKELERLQLERRELARQQSEDRQPEAETTVAQPEDQTTVSQPDTKTTVSQPEAPTEGGREAGAQPEPSPLEPKHKDEG